MFCRKSVKWAVLSPLPCRAEEGVVLTLRPVSPVILSASRVTDIPAFYMPWFLHRLHQGYSVRVNPYNKLRQHISYERVRAVVFWSKNPAPLLSAVPLLEEMGLGFYLQFTLNDYEQEGWEPGLPPLEARIELFKKLSLLLGKKRVLWRFDPLILSAALSAEELAARLLTIGDRLTPLTDRLTVSFLDISPYRSVRSRLQKSSFSLRVPSEDEELFFIKFLSRAQHRWQDINPEFTIKTCAEGDWGEWGIAPASCVDGVLLRSLYPGDEDLTSFLEKAKKDPSQRSSCRCIESRDVGAYGTCRYGCIYCYARFNDRPFLQESFTAESLSDMI